MLTLRLDRDSVTMGDDMESHLLTWHLDDDVTLAEVVRRTVESRYLPANVTGCWQVRAEDGTPLALLRMTREEPVWVTSLVHRALGTPLVDLAPPFEGRVLLHWSHPPEAWSLSWDELLAQLG